MSDTLLNEDNNLLSNFVTFGEKSNLRDRSIGQYVLELVQVVC